MSEKTDKWLAVSTGLIACLTALSLGVSMYAASVAHQQWQVANGANQLTIAAAKETTDAVFKQTRAYVTLDRVFLTNLDFKDKDNGIAVSPITSSSRVKYSIVNVGATPAFHALERATAMFLPKKVFIDDQAPRLSPNAAELLQLAKDFRFGGTLGKDKFDSTDAAWKDGPVLDHVADFTAGETLIYVDVNVIYRDVYDLPHFLRGCFAFESAATIIRETGEIIQHADCSAEYDEYPNANANESGPKTEWIR